MKPDSGMQNAQISFEADKAKAATEEAAQSIGEAVEQAANDVKDAAKEAVIDKIDEAANNAKEAIKNK